MKRSFVILLALILLLSGCGGKGDYVPTGDGLSYDEDYTEQIKQYEDDGSLTYQWTVQSL